jgi:hypothetical protein
VDFLQAPAPGQCTHGGGCGSALAHAALFVLGFSPANYALAVRAKDRAPRVTNEDDERMLSA